MTAFTLVLANKNYSSWSMRGWLVMEQTGQAFDEIVVPLDRPDTAPEIDRHSPSGLVPVLKHGATRVWDSLAITEYLHERFPESGLWPADAGARAVARAVAAEMHSGFRALRTHMPMNIRASRPGQGRADGVEQDIRRVTAIWRDCRGGFGAAGPFLFGPWCAADAFYAPVVTRFRTYGVALDALCHAYAEAVVAHPPVARFIAAATAEPWAIPRYDAPDPPLVPAHGR